MKAYRVIGGIITTVVLLIVGGWLLLRGQQLDVLQPAGEVAVKERNLLVIAVALMMIVVVPVFVMLGLFAFRYRAGNKAEYKPEWSENKKLEILWWGIPALVIGSLAVMTWFTSHSLDPYKPLVSNKSTIEVQVVALQWKWLFIYPELGVASLNQLPMPVGHPVHFTLTSDAPMNAFWIPALGSQIYTMNGMSSQLNLIADKTGDFQGKTTNISGEGYASMTFVTKVRSEAEFQQWVTSARHSMDMMDESAYKTLATPGTEGEKSYMLMDKNLYQKIVDTYMMPSADVDHSSTGMDHHSMEGM